MASVLIIKKELNEGIRDFVRYLLETGKVKGVFCLAREGLSGVVRYALITEAGRVSDAVPFYPVMPNNAAKMLSWITLHGSAKDPIAAVIRPCELRAFVEVAKRRQADPSNIIIISSICAGVVPLKQLVRGDEDQLVSEYWTAAAGTEPLAGTRDACRGCENFVPANADFIVSIAGRKNIDRECRIFPATEKALALCGDMDADREEDEIESAEVRLLGENRRVVRRDMERDLEKNASGLSGIVNLFTACVNCRACRTVCPICYCVRCEFDAPRWEHTPEELEASVCKRGGVRLPSGTLNFQLGRLLHMGVSCVGCGMCSDVCPADIPVFGLFSTTGRSVQEMFNYLPGKNTEEKLPLTVFREKELSEVER
jgi:formate dehydrogenase subunit beta